MDIKIKRNSFLYISIKAQKFFFCLLSISNSNYIAELFYRLLYGWTLNGDGQCPMNITKAIKSTP